MQREREDALFSRHRIFAYDKKRSENPSGYIVDTMQALFQALFSTSSFEDCLIDIVNRGDTTGAIAGMLAGARYGLEAIPQRWLKDLDPAINERCSAQANDLLNMQHSGQHEGKRGA